MRNPFRIHISLRETYLLPYILMYHKRHKKSHYSGPKSNLERENGTTTTCSTSTNIFNTCRCRIIQFLKVNGRATWESIFGARVTTNYYKFPRERPCQPFGRHLVVVKSFFFASHLQHFDMTHRVAMDICTFSFVTLRSNETFQPFIFFCVTLLSSLVECCGTRYQASMSFPYLQDFMSMGST